MRAYKALRAGGVFRGAAMAAALLFSLTGCVVYDNFAAAFLGAAPADDVVRIGVFEPLSGADKEAGELELAGIELAHALYPEVLGKPVELVVADNRSGIDEAKNAALWLADRQVSVVLGSYRSTLSLAGGEIFEERGIPAISVSNSNPLVTNANDYYFRVRYVESFQGVAIAKYAVEELQTAKAAVMREIGNDFAAAVSQAFSDKYTALTGDPESVVYTADYPADMADYSGEFAKIKETGAEVVFLPAAAEAAVEIVARAQDSGVQALFLGTDLWEAEALLQAGDSAVTDKMAFSAELGQDLEQSAPAKEFMAAFREKYGAEAVPAAATALAFDAYMLAREAIGSAGAGAGRDAVKTALAKTKSFAGVSGSITFDENGDPIKSVPIRAVRDGAFVTLYTAEPNWGEDPEEEPTQG
ncbi:MAG: ABC transporter substrate-binding protein [Clostridiales Family XIII bacterium]|nr:ABC transporter substrate-binding protein [Clostridiales Family XIII bacterium]